MDNEILFAIMPYLKTYQPVQIRGFTFWPSQTLEENEDLSESHKQHLRTLFTLFYLKNDVHIEDMLYSVLDSSDVKNSELLLRLREVRVLIGYFYTVPHFPGGEPFLRYEHADLYLFRPSKVSKFLLDPSFKSSDTTPENRVSAHMDSYVGGYEGSLNLQDMLWTAIGSRLYPPSPSFWLNISQNLERDLFFEKRNRHWSFLELINSKEVKDEGLENRIFTAMEWYNRSSSVRISEEVALVNLAIAFESLFGFEQGKDITDKFREFILSLLGKDARLESWIEQFYRARSKIVHEGAWSHLAFYASDSSMYHDILKGKQIGVKYRSLTSYGRRIFRLCLSAILSSNLMALQEGLRSLLYHNQERLQAICVRLSSDIPATDKLKLIAKDIMDLDEYYFESEYTTEVKTIIGTAKLLVKTYLETSPDITDEIKKLFEAVFKPAYDASDADQLELYEKLTEHLDQISNLTYEWPDSPTQPFEVVRIYFHFATSPGFMLKSRGYNTGLYRY